jgi:putative nucleotidyltransferase with HDIG domain
MTESILVVGQELQIRENIVSVLTSAKYQYREAPSRQEALALLDAGEEFDLVLCSLTTMALNGRNIEGLHAQYPDLPFVLLASEQDVSLIHAAIRKGAYDYVSQPFDSDELLETVRRALEYRRLRLENRAYQGNLEALVMARTDQLRRAVKELEESYDCTIEALGQALAMKDPAIAAHSKRVTAFVVAIAKTMGVPSDQIRVMARAAFLHDVGKLATPETILRKSSVLAEPETAVMRDHCLRGYETLKPISFLAEAADSVYSHHERYDGRGYPRGLKGEEIPLGARIIGVANTLDVMTSTQPYRPAQSLAIARQEIVSEAGRQFDPEVVKTFASMPENLWSALRQDAERGGEKGRTNPD